MQIENTQSQKKSRVTKELCNDDDRIFHPPYHHPFALSLRWQNINACQLKRKNSVFS